MCVCLGYSVVVVDEDRKEEGRTQQLGIGGLATRQHQQRHTGYDKFSVDPRCVTMFVFFSDDDTRSLSLVFTRTRFFFLFL